MANNFHELADRTKTGWSSDTRRVYEAASAEFRAQMDERAELGAAIASARKARSLTQSALAILTGVQQAEISRIERGIGNPTSATLFRLAGAVGRKLELIPARD